MGWCPVTYNGREVMAQIAVKHDVHILEDVFASREDDNLVYVAYIGRGKILALIGWDENNCAPYVEAYPASEDARPIYGATALIEIRKVIEGKDNA